MLAQLILNNTFFAINIIVFMALFMVGWLHLDSWKVNKKVIFTLYKAIGFISLSLYFLIISTQTNDVFFNYAGSIVKIYGLLMILGGLTQTLLKKPENAAFLFPISIPLSLITTYSPIFTGFLCLIITILFFIRITKGLEKQIKALGIAFIFLTLSEILRILYFFKDSPIVYVNQLLSSFGLASILINLFVFVSAVIFLIWVFNYIRFRVEIQLFVTTLSLTVLIFLAITFSFSFLLLKNIEKNILDSIETDGKIALFSIERLEFEALSSTKAASLNPQIWEEFDSANEFLLNQNLGFLNFFDSNGKLILSSEDEFATNISVSNDPLFLNATEGNSLATLAINEGPIAPSLVVKASTLISDLDEDQNKVVIGGFYVDSPFLDGIKDFSGLDLTVFGNDTRSASTIFSGDNNSRLIGTKETDEKILEQVLQKGDIYKGSGKINNRPYYFVYLPLKSYSNEIIGMIQAGKPQSEIINTAQQAFKNTYLVSALLLLFFSLPVYLISKFIKENLTA